MVSARTAAAALASALALALAVAAPASAAVECDEPGARWERATPAEAGMDAERLRDALDYGTANLSFAVRVYRNGCLVGEDGGANVNRGIVFESYSMAKSITAMLFGRAMTLGHISPDDPVGALFPEADEAHGAITMRQLLEMTSGLHWNGFRDYNVFTDGDRVRDALTLPVDRQPGTYFEYAQSAVTLLAEAVGRAVGRDAGSFVQRELMAPLGISSRRWKWSRDDAGHIYGFWGVNMRPDDYGRLGELLRRGGVWRGQRLLAREFVERATSPTPTNGCYGWLIWVNAAAPCVGPTVVGRPADDARMFPDLPADMYKFSGLFGQLVTVFPSLDLVVVRNGQDPSLVFAGAGDWEHGLYTRILGSIVDGTPVEQPGEAPRVNDERPNPDYGFQTAFQHPDVYSRATFQDPLPPAGPARARAPRLRLGRARASRTGVVTVLLACPRHWPGDAIRRCTGSARLEGARRAVSYDVEPGRWETLRFRLGGRTLRSLRRAGSDTLELSATNRDAAGGTTSQIEATVRRPARR